MDWIDGLILVLTGGAAGFTGGLLGVGGGLIFTPVLFFYFQSVGISDEHVTALAIGTGLLCTLVVALSSTVGHWRKAAVSLRVAIYCGFASVIAIVFTTSVITTSSWYTPWIYRVVFSIFLVIVAVKMIRRSRVSDIHDVSSRVAEASDRPRHLLYYIFGGSLAGFVASLVGVGGGIVLVPLYDRFLGLPIRRAMGTSSATIVFITFVAVIGYVVNGPDTTISEFSIGYVDFGRALLMSIPAAMSARAGVNLAHRINQRRLRLIFAGLALLVALRISLSAAGVF